MKVKDILLFCSPGGRERIKELERYGPELAPKPRKSRDPRTHPHYSHDPPPRHHPPPLVSLDFLRPRPSRSRHSSGSASGGSSASSSSLVGLGKSTFYDIDEERLTQRDRKGQRTTSKTSPVPSTSSEEQSVVENLDNYDLSSLAHAIDSNLKVGDRVVWLRETPQTNEAGVVRWLGVIENEEVAGVDFDNRLDIGSGWYRNERLFQCTPNHGGLIAVVGLILESELRQQCAYPEDFDEPDSSTSNSRFSSSGTTAMPSTPFIAPPLGEEDADGIGGFNKGVQGNNNSCYLDATLFAMFPFNSVFDSILVTPYQSLGVPGGDRKLADDVQRILREDIVNPLRTTGFTSGAKVMKLRAAMQHLDGKLISSEMDPAEFLEMLFSAVLHLDGFLTLSSGQSEFFHQVVVTGQAEKVPTVQALLEESLLGQGSLKFTGVPSPALILQMPRSGNNFKMFKGLLPNLTIDITDLIQDIPRMCIICGALATEECRDCLGLFNAKESSREESGSRTPLGSGAFTTAFCRACLQRVHLKPDRRAHLQRVTPIPYSFNPDIYFQSPPCVGQRSSNGVTSSTPDYYPASYFSSPGDPNASSYGLPNSISNSTTSPLYLQPLSSSTPHPNHPLFITSSKNISRVTMDLLAVICIEKSHFVSFVRCGRERYAPWVFFDSMADREERIGGTGYNIPQVTVLPQMGKWLHQLEHHPGRLIGCLENPEENNLLKRLVSDAYICFYYSPESSMYA